MSALTPTQKSILKLLADGRFHSSGDVARSLDISRTTAWHHMQSLEQTGIELYAVQGKGTRLAEPLELLNHERIIDGLTVPATSELGELILLDETPSTNQYLMTRRLQGLPNGTACLAEMQTQGKGRLVEPGCRRLDGTFTCRCCGDLMEIYRVCPG